MPRNKPNNFQRFYLSDNQISKARNNNIKNQIWLYYYETILEDYLSIFKWENLPNNIPQYAIEWALLKYGHFAMWQKENIVMDNENLPDIQNEFIASNYTIVRYDRYYRPFQINTSPLFPNTVDNDYKILFDDEFVYCLNNKSGASTYNKIMFYVNMLTDIEVSIKLTTRQLRQPYIFEGTKGSKQTITDLMKKIDDGNVEYFVINKDFMQDGNLVLHNLLGMDSSKRLDTLYMLKEKYLQELYTQIGTHPNINNKKERLTENESIGYNEIGNLHINGQLDERKDFCRRVNERFGLNISVTFSTDIRPLPDYEDEEINIEDEEIDLTNEESEDNDNDNIRNNS